VNFKQGDIVKFSFDPTLGHEQSGYRPAVVISKDLYNERTQQIVVCPITSKAKALPMRIVLDSGTQTQGYVICDQIRTIDVIARKPQFSERMPDDILTQIRQTVIAIIE
jgi:mRNA interferase MazF